MSDAITATLADVKFGDRDVKVNGVPLIDALVGLHRAARAARTRLDALRREAADRGDTIGASLRHGDWVQADQAVGIASHLLEEAMCREAGHAAVWRDSAELYRITSERRELCWRQL